MNASAPVAEEELETAMQRLALAHDTPPKRPKIPAGPPPCNTRRGDHEEPSHVSAYAPMRPTFGWPAGAPALMAVVVAASTAAQKLVDGHDRASAFRNPIACRPVCSIPDQELPSQVVEWPEPSTATQKRAVAHETAVTPEGPLPLGSTVAGVDHDVPCQADATRTSALGGAGEE